MDKSHTEFLEEIRAELERLKGAIAALEEKLAASEAEAAAEAEVAAEADIEMPEVDSAEAADFTDFEIGAVEDLEDLPEAIPEPVVEPEPEAAPAEAEPEPEPVPEPKPAPAPKPKAKPVPEGNYPWQQARPGVSVKHIRSGISLLDRAQFITILFKEDYALYDSTLAALDAMESLDDAVAYLMEQFPQWNYKSDIVFSFMMAVRKKLG